ncbi:hypothetical protein T265_04645 [Opisthorchis viverrini]|uniref:Uncharacterized protein n=1 Tax=Opisthorchis viverrini TaxID=6198 RepID=A0A074ZZ73_OPIVI|nr:hypothetical protein T265_04645 [Opisthorchis viverrini]KER28605.1 hypothetical protein T265_04645 [Opisthorchis viverrini]
MVSILAEMLPAWESLDFCEMRTTIGSQKRLPNIRHGEELEAAPPIDELFNEPDCVYMPVYKSSSNGIHGSYVCGSEAQMFQNLLLQANDI